MQFACLFVASEFRQLGKRRGGLIHKIYRAQSEKHTPHTHTQINNSPTYTQIHTHTKRLNRHGIK